jgi:hypothetical protein
MIGTHVFEKAGLGLAPFRWVGVEIRRGPMRVEDPKGGIITEVGAPGQPMGSCAYCGQGIAECHLIRSADGKVFTVGCVCVGKTGDRGLIQKTKKEANRIKKAREKERIKAAQEHLKNEAVRMMLRQMACLTGHNPSALECVEWFFENAGHTGKLKAARTVERARKAVK